VLLLVLALLADPRADLVEARHKFEQGDYAAASALLRPLVDAGVFGDAADRNEALRLYGVASFLEGRRGDAEGAFTALLVHDSNARLDAALYPPDVVAFFDAIRARREAELARTAHKARKHFVLTLIPFGVGQFQNDQPRKGWILAGLEGALVISATTTFILLKNNEQQGHTFSDTSEARTLRNVNLASVVALGATAAYGLIDAIYYYQRGEQEPTTRATAVPVPGGVLFSASCGF
jgi:hypothetical protein